MKSSQAKSPSALSSSGDFVDTELVTIGNNDHDYFSMVTSEMLCELVKQAFSQAEAQVTTWTFYLHYCQSKGEILARVGNIIASAGE